MNILIIGSGGREHALAADLGVHGTRNDTDEAVGDVHGEFVDGFVEDVGDIVEGIGDVVLIFAHVVGVEVEIREFTVDLGIPQLGVSVSS